MYNTFQKENNVYNCIYHRFVAAFYLCMNDLNKQNGFDRSKISNDGRQYVEEHES